MKRFYMKQFIVNIDIFFWLNQIKIEKCEKKRNKL